MTSRLRTTGALLAGVLIVLAAGGTRTAAADDPASLHPEIPFLDADGRNVLDSDAPVSPMQTCGTCHDTEFIASHSGHADAGLGEYGSGGPVPWDAGGGWFGAWDPTTYRLLTPIGGDQLDLGTPEWLATLGTRHPGGGPAEFSRDGSTPLQRLSADAASPETAWLDPATGLASEWNWGASGSVELDCFICHYQDASIETRSLALERGRFASAAQGSLCGTGVVFHEGEECRWDPFAFGSDGEALDLVPQAPTSATCGRCHGVVHTDDVPLNPEPYHPLFDRTSVLTGQVFSWQRVSDSGLNISGKDGLSRSWDVHAERVVECVDCHHSANNPAFFREGDETRPDHLIVDGRRLDIGEYLLKPSHELAPIACTDCHDAGVTHEWLPYRDRHFEALACETCHVPAVLAPAAAVYDWTVLDAAGAPRIEWRGIDGEQGSPDALITGYTPAVVPREDGRLGPANLISSWYWVAGDPVRPVRLLDLKAALLDDDGHRPEVIAALDENGDGALTASELRLDEAADVEAVRGLLIAAGIPSPEILGEVREHEINHGVATGDWATGECSTCHGQDSILEAPFDLAASAPGGVVPAVLGPAAGGEVIQAGDGTLRFDSAAATGDVYVFGSDRVLWIDIAGTLVFLLVLAGIGTHGVLRWRAARARGEQPETQVERVYMYSVYERLWHWVQTAVVLILLFTGLVIHSPDLFGVFAFGWVVGVHNVMAAVLVVNAILAVFYHVASGEIRQFVPRPRGFFDRAAAQAVYYVRGIFKGEPHPFAKDARRKLNPLQQVTYFGILNVLLPLQVLSGILIWGAQRWPGLTGWFGGLPVIAPVHALVAWLFAAFIVLHVYLTTTGHTPLSNVRAMVTGWDELEIHESEEVAAP